MEKVLVLFKYYNDAKLAIKNYKALKEKFGFKILPLYIKDLKITIPIGNTFLNSGVVIDTVREYEDDYIEKVRQLLENEKIEEELSVEMGLNKDIIEDYLKKTDLLLIEETGHLDDEFLEILKITYKPVIIVNREVSTFKKVAIVSDNGIKINKSTTIFLKLFPDYKDVTIISWNYNEEENELYTFLKEKGMDIKIELFNSKFNTKNEFFERVNQFDFIVMGNLSKSFFFEKITKRMGVDLIEKLEKPIFIG
ncbi:hypothetical protein [uncultured Cetobacterium sp.]|uniref:hypothetical protein n=1 Tax=uncultured Cetobacterium sp. TaxID=527638 RepID=UPI0026206A95|nr:hypothetical protein [uncultured Cetobacterium sp.]